MKKVDRLSLDHMEKVLSQIETNLGLNQSESGPKEKVTGLVVYDLARSLFFSVPISRDQESWSEEQKDEAFQKQYLGCTKRHFVATMDARIRRAARRRAREKELKRRK